MKKFLPLFIFFIVVVIDRHSPADPFEWFVIDNTGTEFNIDSSTDFWTVAEAKADWENTYKYLHLTREYKYEEAYNYSIEPYNKGRYWHQ